MNLLFLPCNPLIEKARPPGVQRKTGSPAASARNQEEIQIKLERSIKSAAAMPPVTPPPPPPTKKINKNSKTNCTGTQTTETILPKGPKEADQQVGEAIGRKSPANGRRLWLKGLWRLPQ